MSHCIMYHFREHGNLIRNSSNLMKAKVQPPNVRRYWNVKQRVLLPEVYLVVPRRSHTPVFHAFVTRKIMCFVRLSFFQILQSIS